MASNIPQQQQSSSMSSLVWFLLLDSATGEPYKRTSADAVSLPSTAVIAQFRKAVHVENSSILTGITSSQLLVYKNKAAFDKRNAAVVGGKEEPLEEDTLMGGLGLSKKESLVVVVPSATRFPELDRLGQEIKALENSEKYQTLAFKNRTWALPEPSEQEKWEWQLLEEKLADLKKKEDFYQKAILSSLAQSVKKSDKTRKGSRKDTAIKDERLLLSDVAITMWGRFGFTHEHNGRLTFEDFTRAAGFTDDADVCIYFYKKARGEVEEDAIKESFTREAWIWLIGLNQRVNAVFHDRLITNRDGSLRLVLEHDIYEDGIVIAENVIRTLYGTSKKVNIEDAASDLSTST